MERSVFEGAEAAGARPLALNPVSTKLGSIVSAGTLWLKVHIGGHRIANQKGKSLSMNGQDDLM